MSEGELRLYKDLVNSEYVSHIDFKLIAKKIFDELQQKENIIKEVREYVKNLREDDEYLEELHFSYDDKYKLLEILEGGKE